MNLIQVVTLILLVYLPLYLGCVSEEETREANEVMADILKSKELQTMHAQRLCLPVYQISQDR